MGFARDDENSHPGHGYVPKLIVAGRLTGSLDGRPVVIEAADSGVVFIASQLKTAWALRRSAGSLMPVLGMLQQCGIPVRLSLAGLVALELSPRPNPLVRMMTPGISRLG